MKLTIEAGKADKYYWKDLWTFRELFLFLAWRDVLVRYKQTVIGIAWALIRPFLTMIVFTVVFGNIANLPSNGVPYPVLVFAGMLPWQFFANSLAEASNSLIVNANLITKVYFPRLIIPAGSIIVSFVDFLLSGLIFLGLMVWYQFIPDWRIVFLPVFILASVAASFGLGLWLALITARFRDFRFVVPFIVQFGLYISPVGFSSNVIPAEWHLLYALNPMVGIIDGFRWCLLSGKTPLNPLDLLISFVIITFFLVTGIKYFRKLERLFADII